MTCAIHATGDSRRQSGCMLDGSCQTPNDFAFVQVHGSEPKYKVLFNATQLFLANANKFWIFGML